MQVNPRRATLGMMLLSAGLIIIYLAVGAFMRDEAYGQAAATSLLFFAASICWAWDRRRK